MAGNGTLLYMGITPGFGAGEAQASTVSPSAALRLTGYNNAMSKINGGTPIGSCCKMFDTQIGYPNFPTTWAGSQTAAIVAASNGQLLLPIIVFNNIPSAATIQSFIQTKLPGGQRCGFQYQSEGDGSVATMVADYHTISVNLNTALAAIGGTFYIRANFPLITGALMSTYTSSAPITWIPHKADVDAYGADLYQHLGGSQAVGAQSDSRYQNYLKAIAARWAADGTVGGKPVLAFTEYGISVQNTSQDAARAALWDKDFQYMTGASRPGDHVLCWAWWYQMDTQPLSSGSKAYCFPCLDASGNATNSEPLSIAQFKKMVTASGPGGGGTGGETISVTNPGSQTGTVGTVIAALQLAGSNSLSNPMTYSASGLPGGLACSSAGRITGTPTAQGSFTVSVTGTDSVTGLSSTVLFTWAIAAAAGETISVTNPGIQFGTVNLAVTPLQLTASNSLGNPMVYSATGLPAGLTCSSAGRITGTPSASGTFSVTARATDSATNLSATAAFSWTVAPGSVSYSGAPLDTKVAVTPLGSSAATSIAVPMPACNAGHMLILSVFASGIPITPSGWTALSAAGDSLGVYWKVATGAESAAFTVSFNSPCAASANIASYPASTTPVIPSGIAPPPPPPPPPPSNYQTIGFFTDTHFNDSISVTRNTETRAAANLQGYNHWINLGDMTDNATAPQYTLFDTTYGDLKTAGTVDHAIGNHDVEGADAGANYNAYWSVSTHYYSFDIASWHCIVVAANQHEYPTSGNAQYNWIVADLAANKTKPTFIVYHTPRWNIGSVHGDDTGVSDLWALFAANPQVEFCVSGHEHAYQRFYRQTAAGTRDDANGVVQFVAPTAGLPYSTETMTPRATCAAYASHAPYGSLAIRLYSDHYQWRVIPATNSPALESTAGTDASTWNSQTIRVGVGAIPTLYHYTANEASSYAAPTALGFNLHDVPDNATANTLPAGTQGMVWIGIGTSAITAATKALIDSCANNTKVWGYYLVDEPQAADGTSAANIKAHCDYIRTASSGRQKSFILLTDWPGTYAAYRPAVTGVDFVGLDPYPVTSSGYDASMVDTFVNQAVAAGVPVNQIVPVYQCFGSENVPSQGTWRMPTTAQFAAILARWDALVPNPVMDYAYCWGHNADSNPTLVDNPTMQATLAARFGGSAPVTGPVTVAVFTDMQFDGSSGTTSIGQDIVAKMTALAPDAIIFGGDHTNDNTSAEWTALTTTWAPIKSKVNPVMGNHDSTGDGGSGAPAGYWNYWGALHGANPISYYSWDLGGWHFLNLDVSGDSYAYSSGSTQYNWAAADLAAHSTMPTIVTWHEGRYSSSSAHGSNTGATALWNMLLTHPQVEMVLSGHQHVYERYPRMNGAGVQDDVNGIRQFTVFASGQIATTSSTGTPKPTVYQNGSAYGYLKLLLYKDHYEWQTVTGAGAPAFSDSGTQLVRTPIPTFAPEEGALAPQLGAQAPSSGVSYSPPFPSGVADGQTVLLIAAQSVPGGGAGGLNLPADWAWTIPPIAPTMVDWSSVVIPNLGTASRSGPASSSPLLTSNRVSVFNYYYVAFTVTGSDPGWLRVTAKGTGMGPGAGLAMTVKALTGALSVAGAKASTPAKSGAPSQLIVPGSTGSVIYGAAWARAGGVLVPASGTTFIQNFYNSAARGNAGPATFATFRSTGLTTAGAAMTLGGASPSSPVTDIALAEIRPSGVIAEAVTALASAYTPDDYAHPDPQQTAIFTTPPPAGSLLIAQIAFGHQNDATVPPNSPAMPITVTDSRGSVWSEVARAAGSAYAGIWVAAAQGGVTSPGTASLSGTGLMTAAATVHSGGGTIVPGSAVLSGTGTMSAAGTVSAPGGTGHVTVVSISDVQNNVQKWVPQGTAVMNMVKTISYDMLVNIGDEVNDPSDGITNTSWVPYKTMWDWAKAKFKPAHGSVAHVTLANWLLYYGTPSSGHPWYSWDLGGWHFVMADSDEDCTTTSAQYAWIQADLAAHPNVPTIMYWHQPPWSSGSRHHGGDGFPGTRELFALANSHGVELTVHGHVHVYERYDRLVPSGATAAVVDAVNGTRVIGMGNSGQSANSDDTPQTESTLAGGPNPVVWGSGINHSALELRLFKDHYEWQIHLAPGYDQTLYTGSMASPTHITADSGTQLVRHPIP